MRRASVENMRKALMRSNTRLLLSAVMLFQFSAMLLIAFQERPYDAQALILAAAIPAATWLVTMLFGKIWPVDRAIVILAMLLCSVGVITLSDIARAKSTPLTQAIYAAVGVGAMAFGIAFIRGLKNWKRSPGWCCACWRSCRRGCSAGGSTARATGSCSSRTN